MTQPFWEHYPKKFWVAADWAAWEKAGRPRVPRHLDLQPAPEQEVGNPVPVPPPGPKIASGFTLFPKPSKREVTSATSRAVDRLIEKHVGR